MYHGKLRAYESSQGNFCSTQNRICHSKTDKQEIDVINTILLQANYTLSQPLKHAEYLNFNRYRNELQHNSLTASKCLSLYQGKLWPDSLVITLLARIAYSHNPAILQSGNRHCTGCNKGAQSLRPEQLQTLDMETEHDQCCSMTYTVQQLAGSELHLSEIQRTIISRYLTVQTPSALVIMLPTPSSFFCARLSSKAS